jgi:flagellar hook assembly protein FlgD
MNMPNPFSLETTFTLDHSHPGDELEISLEIFNLSGRRVLSWSTSAMSTGTTIPYFTWNGTDASGGNLDNGMYLYKVTVTAESGDVTSTVQKLIISR